MKKVFLGVMAAVACFSLASCGSDKDDVKDDVKGLKVTVLMPDDKPATGVSVQWCEERCKTPIAVDKNGVAVLENYDDVDYNVHVINTPAGYTYNPYEVVQNNTNKVSTIKLIKLDDVKSGEGKESSPYVIGEGWYSVSLANKDEFKYYQITPTKAGKLVFESFAEPQDDPWIGYYGESSNISYQKSYSENDGNELNFKYEFDVTAENVSLGKTYVFGINATTAAKFSFKVSIN